MISIADAYDAVEERKAAVLGEAVDLTLSDPNLFQRRAMFSGFDLDDDELAQISERAGRFMAQLAATSTMTLSESFSTLWIDAFFTGLMYEKLHKSNAIDT